MSVLKKQLFCFLKTSSHWHIPIHISTTYSSNTRVELISLRLSYASVGILAVFISSGTGNINVRVFHLTLLQAQKYEE